MTPHVTGCAIGFSRSGDEASLHPELSIAPHRWGYVQFTLQFVATGTYAPVKVPGVPSKGGFLDSPAAMRLDVMASTPSSYTVRMYASSRDGLGLHVTASLLLQKAIPEIAEGTEKMVVIPYYNQKLAFN
ncbi:MAG TPA: hypothetical protein VKT28_19370 [Puia sp.]|nr:hypothetical protein [Puia sp.]